MKELTIKRRHIPPINKVVQRLQDIAAPASIPHNLAVQWARELTQRMRSEAAFLLEDQDLRDYVAPVLFPGPRKVLNGTGILLHTNLGRAPLDEAVLAKAIEQVKGYTDLELSLVDGKRGHRDRRFASLARRLWQVEDATLVNNAASAVTLTLAALAAGRETVVSRGELIEIGGSFRMPDIMAFAGTKLREVGTTNKTRIGDYERALNPQSACLFKAHPSNYQIQGFTLETSLEDLTSLGKERHIPVVMDLGSGYSEAHHIQHITEDSIESCLKAQPDVLIFSGDKLLGGVQAGIILGNASAIEKIRRHTMMRMVRVDKLTQSLVCHQLSALALQHQAPITQLANTTVEAMRQRAEAIVAQLPQKTFVWEPSENFIGGGSVPGQSRPSIALVCRRGSAQELADKLRGGSPPLIGYIQKDALYVNLATILPEQDGELLNCLKTLLA